MANLLACLRLSIHESDAVVVDANRDTANVLPAVHHTAAVSEVAGENRLSVAEDVSEVTFVDDYSAPWLADESQTLGCKPTIPLFSQQTKRIPKQERSVESAGPKCCSQVPPISGGRL